MPKIEITGVSAASSARYTGVFFHRILREPGRAERRQLGMLQLQVFGAGEEFLVLRIRAGPAAFDVVDSELVELFGDQKLVLDRERDGLALRAIPQRRIEGEDLHGLLSFALTFYRQNS